MTKEQKLQEKTSGQIYDNLMNQIYDELFRILTTKQLEAIVDKVILADDMVLEQSAKENVEDEETEQQLKFLKKARNIALSNLKSDVFRIYYEITN